MRANTAEDSGRTFTENARRKQIVQAAIETIAELGYTKASFAEIAKRAGLSSKGLISYHFASKEELVERIVLEVYSELRAFMTERLDAQPTAAATLRAYIEGNIEFAVARSAQMKALMDIFVSGGLAYDADNDSATMSPLEGILRQGQENGEFRDFDVEIVATSIQRAVEGPNFMLMRRPDLDLAAYSAELVTLFDLATRMDR